MTRFKLVGALAALLSVYSVSAGGCSDDMSGADKAGMAPRENFEEYPGDTAGGDYSDVDADADADMGAEDTGYPPEIEQTAKYTEPMGAGRYVFIPDENRDAVVVVDSETLVIQVVEVGSRPTHMVTLQEGSLTRVAVINLNSDEVTVIEVNRDGDVDTFDIPVRPDTNALAPCPDGRFIIAYHDPNLTAVSGTPRTDQEISVLSVETGESVERSVGMHPWKVEYSDDGSKAFVVTEGGINVIDLKDLDDIRSDPISLFEAGSYTSTSADIEITSDGKVAIGRKSGMAELKVGWLDGSDEERTYTLPVVPTDLDIAEDSSFGVLVFRELSQVAFFDLPFPAAAESDPFTYVDLPDKIVGVATLSQNGDHVLLYTTSAGDDMDRRRLTLMSRNQDGWDINSAVLERYIEAVSTVDSEDGETRTAVVRHQRDTADVDKPYAYSLVTVPSLMSKLQQLSTPPGQLLLTPDGDFGFLLLKEAYKTEIINLGTLIVNELLLSSQPIAAGYAGVTDKVFVAQDHPAGRMTFIGVRDESVSTITGFNLNEEIEVSK